MDEILGCVAKHHLAIDEFEYAFGVFGEIKRFCIRIRERGNAKVLLYMKNPKRMVPITYMELCTYVLSKLLVFLKNKEVYCFYSFFFKIISTRRSAASWLSLLCRTK